MVSNSTARRIGGARTDMTSIKERFGGGDFVAALLGMFTALGVLVFVGALLVAGRGEIGYQLNVIDFDGNLQEVEVVASIVAVAVLFAAFVAGGWAAGRMARYDGPANGVGAALLFVLAVALFGFLGEWLGSEYNAFANAGLPDWFSQLDADDIGLKAAAAALAGMVAVMLGGYIGGAIGEKYHIEADAAVAQSAERAVR